MARANEFPFFPWFPGLKETRELLKLGGSNDPVKQTCTGCPKSDSDSDRPFRRRDRIELLHPTHLRPASTTQDRIAHALTHHLRPTATAAFLTYTVTHAADLRSTTTASKHHAARYDAVPHNTANHL